MKTYQCDILVVGAGPAGSSAALSAARKGLRVWVLERRPAVGIPVRCAEYIPALLLGEINLGRHFLVQAVRGMRTFLPDGQIRELRAPGFMIKRDLFDQALVDAAKNEGAEIFLSTSAVCRDNGDVVVKGEDGLFSRIAAKVIIGADGPHSATGRWIGSVNSHLIPAVQFRVPLVRPMECTEVYFDKEIYGGYGWLFPKGDEANVGLGQRPRDGRSRSMKGALDRFLSQLVEAGKIRAEVSGSMAGWIPAEPPRKVTRENVLLVGDAAGQTHPITGGGITQAVICGRMAGTWAARAVETGDLKILREYEKAWRDLYGDTLNRAFKRRQLLEQEWDHLEKIIKYCWVAFREYYEEPQ